MPKKNTMGDLKDHLFETLEALRDEEKPMDIQRALAVATVADKLIDIAKTEVAFIKATDAAGEGSFAGQSLGSPKAQSPRLGDGSITK